MLGLLALVLVPAAAGASPLDDMISAVSMPTGNEDQRITTRRASERRRCRRR